MTSASRRMSHRLAWLLWWLTIGSTVLDLTFLALNGAAPESPNIFGRSFAAIWALAYAGIGQLLARRRAQNAIGWLFLAFGLVTGAQGFGVEYAVYVVLVHPGALPGGTLVAWIASWIWISQIGVSVYLLFLFPTGQLPSDRWRPVAWATAAVFALMTVAQMFKAGPLRMAPYMDNPFVVPGSDALLNLLGLAGYTAAILCQLAAAAAVIVRLRRARGVERQQLKWFAYVAALSGLVGLGQSGPGAFNVPVPDWWTIFTYLLVMVVAALPITVGIAILRYRLYEIDRIINRTLVYTLLTLVLGAIYFGSVLLLRTLFRTLTGEQPEIVTVLSTLFIAALFVPVRRRIQSAIDQRFYRKHYDAARTVAAFGSAVRDEVDLDQLRERLVGVVNETMQPAYVSL